jgi:hypothetical protein
MSLIGLVLVLVVVGVLLWTVNAYVPMAPPIKAIVNVLVTIAVLLWLLNAFGLVSAGPPVRLR